MKNHRFILTTILLTIGVGCLILLAQPADAKADVTRYVKEGGAGDGTSWATASGTPQDMIDTVELAGGGEVWVAAGTYTPTVMNGGTTPRHLSFQMKNSVGIYGGFPNVGSPSWTDRDWEAFTTSFSGEIGNPGTITDNCYHVFYHPGSLSLDNTAILGGFIISYGNADDSSTPNLSGGGMYNNQCSPLVINSSFHSNFGILGAGMGNWQSSPKLNNCSFQCNDAQGEGGGLYNDVSPAVVSACAFIDNTATIQGGGAFNKDSSPTIIDCSFINNTVTDGPGGGIQNVKGSPIITNCIFTGNTAITDAGGGISYFNSSGTVSNSVLWRNSASIGGAISNYSGNLGTTDPVITNCTLIENNASQDGGGISTGINAFGGWCNPTVTNCVFWGNTSGTLSKVIDEIFVENGTPSFAFCNIQVNPGSPVYPGTGNISLDPMFVDAENGDFHLLPNSPCIDTGTNSAAAAITNDFEGNLRILDGNGDAVPRVDIGVDEVEVIYVKPPADGPYGTDDGSSWADAFDNLQQALAAAGSPCQIWVAAGSYTPAPPGQPGTQTDYFQMQNNVGIYGGFPNVGSPSGIHRNPLLSPTILTGEVGSPNYMNDNCYHVFYHPGNLNLNNSARLDGFTITRAHAVGPGHLGKGGGMYNSGLSGMCSPTIVNCKFSANYGGMGGGMYNDQNGLPLITNCTFWNNSGTQGAGIYNMDSNPIITNVTFNRNNAAVIGGGIDNSNSSPTITNCIFWENINGEISNNGLSLPNVTYSDVQGGYPGIGNIDADPMFVKPEDGDLHTLRHSPCIDSGSDAAAMATGMNIDFDGDRRIIDGDVNGSTIVDMGADEHRIIFVKEDNTGGGTAWTDAYGCLLQALYISHSGDEIWVATGTYTPICPFVNFGECSANSNCSSGQYCQKAVGDCHGGGRHQNKPTACTLLYDPVCGCDGLTYSNDCEAARSGINVAYHGECVGVAKAIPPTIEDHRRMSFYMKNGVDISGGFPATGTPNWANRDWENLITNLSGEIGDPETRSDNSYHVFFHPGGLMLDYTAILNGFTITAGNANGDWWPYFNGGGMYNRDSSQTILNCTFLENNSRDKGGALYNWSESPSLTNCDFLENASTEGGGVYNEADTTPDFTDCFFYQNAARHDGGGMYNWSGSSTLINCAFNENTAIGEGGGMYICCNAYALLEDCTFTDNEAYWGGGMANVQYSSPDLINCTFTTNVAAGTACRGGGMYNSFSSSPFVKETTFVQNVATGTESRGGGIYNWTGSPTFVNCTLLENHATGTGHFDGGGMYNLQTDPQLSKCILNSNTARHGGGMFNSESFTYLERNPRPMIGTKWSYAVHYNCNEVGIYGGTITEINNTVFDYTVTGTEMVNGEFSYVTQTSIDGEAKRHYPYPGGVALSMDVPVVVNGGTESRSYNNNELTREDESLWVNAMGGFNLAFSRDFGYHNRPSTLYVGGTWTYDTEVNIPTFAFYENMTWEARVTGIENVTFSLGTFQCYKVEVNGTGGMLPDATNYYWWDTEGYLPCPVKYVEDYLFLGTETFELSTYIPLREIYDCNFINNVSINSGGGMYNEAESAPRITYSTFDTNQATGTDCFGGGMFNWGGTPTLINTTLSNNTATDGGGMYNLESDPIINNSAFDTNTVTNDGGGIYNQSSKPRIQGGMIRDNSAVNNGGGIVNTYSDPDIASCVLWFNAGTNGGGIYNEHSSPIIGGCEFLGNTANASGGGMYNIYSNPTVQNTKFTSNEAVLGGGILNSTNASPAIRDCTFASNNAVVGAGINNGAPSSHAFITGCIFSANSTGSGMGGGIANYSSGLKLVNSVFDTNTAGSGGGVYNSISNPTITNCSFYNNQSDGLYNHDSLPTVINCIIWGNSGSEIATAVTPDLPHVTYCDIQGGYPGTGNISGTPMWANPGSGDFHLLPSSPCIDSGSNTAILATSVTTDFDGDPRIVNSRVDMGVDESPVGWSPWIYDININSMIDFQEMVNALMDYLLGDITYSQMVEVLMLYLTA